MWKDAIEMRDAVRNRDVSPVELVKECIQTIERLNPKLNAVVHLRAERALQEAETRSFEEKIKNVKFYIKNMKIMYIKLEKEVA